MSGVIRRVQDLVTKNNLIVFAKTGCPYCKKSISHLGNAKLIFHVEQIDTYPATEMNEVQDYFLKTTGAKTVPRIFYKGQCIGGNSDLEAKFVAVGKME